MEHCYIHEVIHNQVYQHIHDLLQLSHLQLVQYIHTMDGVQQFQL